MKPPRTLGLHIHKDGKSASTNCPEEDCLFHTRIMYALADEPAEHRIAELETQLAEKQSQLASLEASNAQLQEELARLKCFVCPVCDWCGLEQDPKSLSYEICLRCGVEFGNEHPEEYPELRQAWVDGGRKWWIIETHREQLRAAEEQLKAKDAEIAAALTILDFMSHDIEDLYDWKDYELPIRDHLADFDDRCFKCRIREALKGATSV